MNKLSICGYYFQHNKVFKTLLLGVSAPSFAERGHELTELLRCLR